MPIRYEIKEQYMGEILAGEIIIRHNEDGTITSFSKDEANSDYQAYLESLKDESK